MTDQQEKLNLLDEFSQEEIAELSSSDLKALELLTLAQEPEQSQSMLESSTPPRSWYRNPRSGYCVLSLDDNT